jgi:hypothetical protein
MKLENKAEQVLPGSERRRNGREKVWERVGGMGEK